MPGSPRSSSLFYGVGLGERLHHHTAIRGVVVFACPVANPSEYGVVEFDATGRVVSIEESLPSPVLGTRFLAPTSTMHKSLRLLVASLLARAVSW